MDAKALLKVAVDRMTPNEAAVVLGKSNIGFLAQAQWARFDAETGQMRTVSGDSISFGVSEITGVRILEDLGAKSPVEYLASRPLEAKKGESVPDRKTMPAKTP